MADMAKEIVKANGFSDGNFLLCSVVFKIGNICSVTALTIFDLSLQLLRF